MQKPEQLNPIDVLHDPTVAAVSVSQASRILGIARSTASYVSASTGELCKGVPVICVGRRRIVSTRHLRAVLGIPEPVAS
jgi:hypothetical protein